MGGRGIILFIIYRAHKKYDAKVMFSAFLSFCPRGGGGGGYSAKKVFMPRERGVLSQKVLMLRGRGGGGTQPKSAQASRGWGS